jgi:hypothetical protein
MSNALAIAGVTAVLKDLLDSGLIDHAANDTLGAGIVVSAGAPDTVSLDDKEAPQLNLFLHQVTPNTAWRNAALPSRDSAGGRISNPPLALDLHYLLTAYGRADLQAEVLLGYALQLLYENPVISRAAIRRALQPEIIDGAILPTIYQTLRSADLAEQVELLRITPSAMGGEEMSRLWSALQARYRPTAAFQVSVVLIESHQPVRSAPPVLSRGGTEPASGRERGVTVFAGLVPPLPTLEAVIPADGHPVATAGSVVRIDGHHLDGADRHITLSIAALQLSRSIPVDGGNTNQVRFTVPDDLPAGLYRLSMSLLRPEDEHARTTNQLPLALAPTPVLPPVSAVRNGSTVTLVLDLAPAVHPGQSVALILGDHEVSADPVFAPSSRLTFKLPNAPETGSTHLVRLRVDGFETPIIDRAAKPMVYLDRRITLP